MEEKNEWAYIFCGNVREHITVYELLKDRISAVNIDPAPAFITGDCSTVVKIPAAEIDNADKILKERYLKFYEFY